MANDNQQSDEQRLIDLLSKRREIQSQSAAGDVEREISELVYNHLHDELRPIFLAKYGKLVDESQASTRFTELLNQFFRKVLDGFPKGLIQAETRRDLSNYISISMQRMIVDHFRSEKVKNRDTRPFDCLVGELERNWKRDCSDVEFPDIMEVLDRWECSGDLRQQEMAKLVRYHYILGVPRERLQRELGVTKSTIYRRLAAALKCLQQEVQP